MALESGSDGDRIVTATMTVDAVSLDPALDTLAEDQLLALQTNLPFLDERLRRAIQRKHGITAANS